MTETKEGWLESAKHVVVSVLCHQDRQTADLALFCKSCVIITQTRPSQIRALVTWAGEEEGGRLRSGSGDTEAQSGPGLASDRGWAQHIEVRAARSVSRELWKLGRGEHLWSTLKLCIQA